MRGNRQPARDAADFRDSPTAWFVELVLAKDSGDFRRAVVAQDELRRLGWSVKYARPRSALSAATA